MILPLRRDRALRPALLLATLLTGLSAWAAMRRGERRSATPRVHVTSPALPLRLDPKADGEVVFKLRLEGLRGREWRVESCNPVVPVVAGRKIPARVCITNFWRTLDADAAGRAELDFGWPIAPGELALRAGVRYRFAITLATDCAGEPGPGDMGDCKTRREVLTPEFSVAR